MNQLSFILSLRKTPLRPACCWAKFEAGQTFELTTPNISPFVPRFPKRSATMGGFISNNDGDGYENVSSKVNSPRFTLIPSPTVRQFFVERIVKDCIEVQEKKKKVVLFCSNLPQNVTSGIFTS